MIRKNELPIELLERTAAMLKVLAHPQRLKIIEMLEKHRQLPVSRIQVHVALSQAATSQHLGHMKKVGLLTSSRRGKEVWYAIHDHRALTILDCIRKKHGSGK